MASTCPNCGKKLHFWNIKAECSACGVSIPNYDWEARLEEDNRNAEKAFGVFNRTLSRMAYSMWGTKLRIARLVLTFLPAVGFILPWSNIKGTGSSFVLSILAFDGSKSLIDFFKAFFGDVGLFTTTMGMEGYGGPVTLGVIGYFLFLLSALFIVIAFFMVLIRCKNSKTKTTIVFDVLSIAASVAAVICFTVGGQRGADLGAFSFGGNAALAPSGSIGWGYFVALFLLLVATGMNIAVVKAPANLTSSWRTNVWRGWLRKKKKSVWLKKNGNWSAYRLPRKPRKKKKLRWKKPSESWLPKRKSVRTRNKPKGAAQLRQIAGPAAPFFVALTGEAGFGIMLRREYSTTGVI